MLNREIVARLVSLLGVKPSAAESKIVDALMGDGAHAVNIIDCSDQGIKWVVLGAIPDNTCLPRVPCLVAAPSHFCETEVVPRLKTEGFPTDRLATSEEVASFFRGRCNGLGEETKGYPKKWAAAAADSVALVSIAGDLMEVRGTTKDTSWPSNHYRWFDLQEVPLGGSVYRISSTRTLWLFTRRRSDGWDITVVPLVGWAHTERGNHDFGTLIKGAQEAVEAMNS